MADRFSAHIIIGGPLPLKKLPGFCDAIKMDRSSLEWGGTPFSPTCTEDLLAALSDGHLHLYNDQIANGEFDTIERWLVSNRIPIIR